jgi:hypothetical protein
MFNKKTLIKTSLGLVTYFCLSFAMQSNASAESTNSFKILGSLREVFGNSTNRKSISDKFDSDSDIKMDAASLSDRSWRLVGYHDGAGKSDGNPTLMDGLDSVVPDMMEFSIAPRENQVNVQVRGLWAKFYDKDFNLINDPEMHKSWLSQAGTAKYSKPIEKLSGHSLEFAVVYYSHLLNAEDIPFAAPSHGNKNSVPEELCPDVKLSCKLFNADSTDTHFLLCKNHKACSMRGGTDFYIFTDALRELVTSKILLDGEVSPAE